MGRRREGKVVFASDLDFDSDLEGWRVSGLHGTLKLAVGARPQRREDEYVVVDSDGGGSGRSCYQDFLGMDNASLVWAWVLV